MSWYRIEHRAGGVASVSIGDEIGIGAPAEQFLVELGRPERIELVIRSNGGCGRTALSACDGLRSLGVPITALVSRAYSAGMVFACAADRVQIMASGLMMTHKCSILTFGDSEALAGEIEALRSIDAKYQQALAKRCKRDFTDVANWLNGTDKYFNAEEALAVGLVDEIVPDPPPCVPTASSPGVEDAPPSSPARTEKEQLLRELLKALGPVDTADLAALRQDLGVWMAYSVRPISPAVPAFKEEHPAGPAEPISSSAGLFQ